MEERDVNQYDYQLEAIDGAPCWRIEAMPWESKTSQYTLTRMCIRKDRYVAAQYQSLIKDQVVRRLHPTDFESVQGIGPQNAGDGDFAVQALRQ